MARARDRAAPSAEPSDGSRPSSRSFAAHTNTVLKKIVTYASTKYHERRMRTYPGTPSWKLDEPLVLVVSSAVRKIGTPKLAATTRAQTPRDDREPQQLLVAAEHVPRGLEQLQGASEAHDLDIGPGAPLLDRGAQDRRERPVASARRAKGVRDMLWRNTAVLAG